MSKFAPAPLPTHDMNITRLTPLSLLLLSEAALAAALPSSLTLEYGPAFIPSDTHRTQPAYDFVVDEFSHPMANTRVRISVIEHLEPPVSTAGPGEICACVTIHLPPRVSRLSFSLPDPLPEPFEYQTSLDYTRLDIGFSVIIDNMGFPAALSTMRVGELETQTIDGIETLTRFAADFRMQFVDFAWVEETEPGVGLVGWTMQYTELPGHWFAGSLRYQSDTAAFALLSPVPEPHAYALVLAGLGLIGWKLRRAGSQATPCG